MRQLVWTESAKADLDSIVEYIAAESPQGAEIVLARLLSTVENMVRHHYGRKGRVIETFEVVVPRTRYIIAYRIGVTPNSVERAEVLHIIHGSREWPEGEWPTTSNNPTVG